MPIAIHSFKVDEDGEISVCHTFYGATVGQAKKTQSDHAKDCPHYGPALAKGETIDIVEEIEALPLAEEEELLEFLDLNDDEEDDDGDER